jgi:hypothetical protein
VPHFGIKPFRLPGESFSSDSSSICGFNYIWAAAGQNTIKVKPLSIDLQIGLSADSQWDLPLFGRQHFSPGLMI